MPVHQPRPQHPIIPSESSTSHLRTAPPSRPSSRSEKLLREALKRDQERPPMPHSPYTAATASPSSVAGRSPTRHRRRHSEIPTGAPAQQRRYEMEEEYARGAMMFRSPVVSTSPRAPSPCDGAPPALARRHSQSQRSQPHQQAAAAPPSRTSQSPTRSPVLARRSSMRSDRSATTTTTGISRSRVPNPLPLHDDNHHHYAAPPMPMMTPHEQVLRARLERVLASAPSHTHNPKRSSGSAYGDDWRREDTSPTAADDERESYVSTSSGSGSAEEDENVVRDENGKARPWRGSCAKPPAMLPTPSSSGSGSARSTSQDGRLPGVGARSRTEPILPAMLHQLPSSPYQHTGYVSPRKSATAPTMAHRSYYRSHHQRSGTTPPLMSDGSPTPPEEEDESPEEEDLKLLTPPATPPTIPAGYHPNNYYAPSPYFSKTHHHHHPSMHLVPVNSAGAERRGRTLVGRGRPPARDVPTFDDSEDEDEDGYECSDDEYAQHHHQQHHYHGAPAMPPNAYGPSARPQQFNVRRASAKAREMAGYVSFSAVEGLGAPPESELSSEEEQQEMRNRKGDGKGGVVGGWVRRLWGSESGAAPQGQQGVVV